MLDFRYISFPEHLLFRGLLEMAPVTGSDRAFGNTTSPVCNRATFFFQRGSASLASLTPPTHA